MEGNGCDLTNVLQSHLPVGTGRDTGSLTQRSVPSFIPVLYTARFLPCGIELEKRFSRSKFRSGTSQILLEHYSTQLVTPNLMNIIIK